MTEFWKSWWAVGCMIMPFILGMTSVAMDVHIACSRHFDVMLAALRKSPGLHRILDIWGGTGVKSRALIVSAVSGGLLMPGYCIRNKLFDADDVKDFPHYLRRRMIISSGLLVICVLWTAVIAALFRYTKNQ